MTTAAAPGVYIEELPSGSRVITGVSTSLTAFVGRALRGPVNEPVHITGFEEFKRRFGGLWAHSPMSQAVRQYFLNGGSEALIVRVVNGSEGEGAARSTVTLGRASIRLRATAAATALPDFGHVRLLVRSTGPGAFDLEVAAIDTDGNPIADQSYTQSDRRLPLTAAALARPGALIEFVDADPDAVPADGTVRTHAGPPRHVVVLGPPGPGQLTLVATGEAAVLEGFRQVRVVLAHTGARTFRLTVEARSATAVLRAEGIDYRYEVDLDLDRPLAAALTAPGVRTGHRVPLRLVELSGTPPTELPAAGTATSTAVVTHDAALPDLVGLGLEARDEGEWGDRLRASVSRPAPGTAATPGAFHLTLTEVDGDENVVAEEVYFNVTVGAADRRGIGRLLALESRLARVTGPLPTGAPDPIVSAAFEGGEDGAEPRIGEDLQGSEDDKTGIFALLKADLFNLLCLPLASWSSLDGAHMTLWEAAVGLCQQERAFLIIDPPSDWSTPALAVAGARTFRVRSTNAALYFPRIRVADPLQEGRLADFPPCGAVAGVIARTDAQRGIWKAPAGTDGHLAGVPALAMPLTDGEQGQLNPLGINCLRQFPVHGALVWGARTLRGADALASEWKYVPVRRLALHLHESLYRGTQWAVFEPNDEPLWSQLRLSIGAFLHQLFRQGAFQGSAPRQAYFVKCDGETTTQDDIDRGIVNIIVGFAPVKPAEFVIIKLQQLADQRDE